VTEAVRQLAELFVSARRAVAFTGAGVSTESGVQDFRSPGGLWDRFDPSEFTCRNFIARIDGRRTCLTCGVAYTRDEVHAWIEASGALPSCPACGGIVKPATVRFGEAMPAPAMREAERRSRAVDLVIRATAGDTMTAITAYVLARLRHSPDPAEGNALGRQPAP
jgi:NAD-dependent SIR2 family protein deacetylase